MSFTLDITQILQYAYNVFGSILPVLYLFVGGAFGAWIFGKLLNLAKG